MAQYTLITGTVRDPTGRIYQNGTFSATFHDPGTSGKLASLSNGQPFEQTITGTLDSFGFFSVLVADNGQIASASGATGTSWNFEFAANASILQLTGIQPIPSFSYSTPIICATNTPVVCGVSMDISTPIQAVSALLPPVSGSGGPTLFAGVPTGPCAATQTAVNTLTGDFYSCVSGAWFKVGPGGVPLSAALKPTLPGDPVQFVSPNGNDTNDGLSWGSAKLTVYKALQSLPGGSSTQVGSGTVLLSGVVSYGGPAASQGMWIMGGLDPNSGSPPSGWLLKSTSGPINIECAFPPIQFAHAHTPACTMTGGGNTDLVHPAIWLSATNTINIKNVGLSNFLNTYVKIGIDSNNNRSTAAGGSSSISLDGLSWNHGSCRFGGGPGLDIGSNTFWIWMRNINGSGCSFGELTIAGSGTPGLSRSANVVTVNTTAPVSITAGPTQWITVQNASDPSFNGSFAVTAVNSSQQFTYAQVGPNATSGNGQVVTAAKAAINHDAGGGSGSGLVFLDNFQLNSGGIRIVPGNQGAGMYIRNGDYEGDGANPDMPMVLVTSQVATSAGTGMNVVVENLEISDPLVSIPGVQIDNGGIPIIKVSRVDKGVSGPALVLGGTPSDFVISDLRQLHPGYNVFGRVVGGGIDVARRGFSPVAVTFPNLASAAPSAWTFETGAGTITSGIAAPDGTTGAGRITSNAGTASVDVFSSLGTTLTVGDAYIYGAWERSNSGGVLSGGGVKLALNSNGQGVGDTCVGGAQSGTTLFSQLFGDGQWIWNSGLCKIATNPNTAGLTLSVPVTNPNVMDVYAPVLIKVPAGTKSDNELYEIALNLSSYSATAVAGDVSMLGGQYFRPGWSTFTNLGAVRNGTTIYCTDCVDNSPCAGGGTGAFAQGLNGVWVCNGAGSNIPFSVVTTGTNTNALVVGTGGSLNASGSGIVNATIVTSATASPALSGVVRLASGDQLCWRNNANSGDDCILKTATDALQLSSFFPVIAGQFASATTPRAAAGFISLATNDAIAWRNTGNTGDIFITLNGVNNFDFSTALLGAPGFYSNAATVSVTGVVRLGTNQTVSWRNNGNTADLGLTLNSSNVFTFAAPIQPPAYLTSTNCSSGASPAVCGSAAAGSVAVPTGTNATLTVNTTAVTANSQIFVQQDDTLGARLSVTCNSTLSSLIVEPVVTARSAGTSFTVTISGTTVTNPVCLSYFIVN
jgi:hypothetical protein